ncbi:MAG: hypothetical protein DRJ26_03315 [Candidatus Methanomethylicota archaeon]|uniref:Ribosomal RNA large subunit methyltransferase K/L-like methyltransferase domain-containing protein n=1 Tax=Thermoproteota archaeon TaxID=2056631 RepID=A0A497F242_9CREN|nr:MAG: hypothetical protein DRJ26_03315 [Candidatus Verstraetearchaeota archaeon]
MSYLLITLPGLEQIVAQEVERKEGIVVNSARGRVLASKLAGTNLRTIESIAEVLAHCKISDTSKRSLRHLIRETLRSSEKVRNAIPSSAKTTVKSAVYSKPKPIDYKALELIAARELARIYKVKLSPKHGDLTLRIEILNEELVIGKVLKSNLHRRKYTKFKHPAMINPLIAAAAAYLAKLSKKDLILDPFCGSGTIPIEAALALNCEAQGSDINSMYVKGALKNAKEAHVTAQVSFFTSAVSKLGVKNRYTAIITDPPRGMRLQVEDLSSIYRELAVAARKALVDGSKLIVVVLRRAREISSRWLSEVGFKLIRELSILQGGVKVHIQYFEKES